MIKSIVKFFSYILSFILSDSFQSGIIYFKNKLFTYSISRKFAHIGSNASFSSNSIIMNPKYMSIGKNFSALVNFRIEARDRSHEQVFSPSIKIGDNVIFNTDCHIGCIDSIEIGDNVLIASRVFITDHSHGDTTSEDLLVIPNNRNLYSKGPVVIEDNVLIGEGVAILSGVTVGRNAIIGANAVVNKNIPANAIAAGSPARVIRIIG